ncbi:MAG TPA: electron transfer flavoprotein subunit alpha [Desulfotomaculum sp.]|nr:electron transfer flavoprotein subunit alpha [Desulfotomaculum sp.]
MIGDIEGKESLWVFIEQYKGAPKQVSLELIAKARMLADKFSLRVAALLIGDNVSTASSVLISAGADTVFLLEHPLLGRYRSDFYAPVILDLIRKGKPGVVIFGATPIGRDLAPAVAALAGTGCTADCVDLELTENGALLQTVPAFGGRMMAVIVTPEQRPQIATVRPGVFQQAWFPEHDGRVVSILPELPPAKFDLVEFVEESIQPSLLTSARVVVAGGAGVDSREGWELLRELTGVLQAALGGSRPALDNGWIEESQMIGHSGPTIRPDLYIAVGISGDVLHMVGVQDAKVIVAVNSDSRAPVFSRSDYGIVGDYREVVPVLINTLKKKQRF